MNQLSDDLLIQRAAEGDKAAFASLYDRYIDKIYRHVCYRVPTEADAQDITQEVFIRAWRSIARYKKGEALFVSWLLVISRNLVSDFYRSRKKEKLVDKEDIQTASDDDPSKEVENRFNAKELRDAISNLQGMKQKVITLRFIDGFSYTEIARILRKTEGAVRVIQFRALIDLKKIMADPTPEDWEDE